MGEAVPVVLGDSPPELNKCKSRSFVNPAFKVGTSTVVYRTGGVHLYHPNTIVAAISEPLGISGRAFVTFPEYELATEWRVQTIIYTCQELL